MKKEIREIVSNIMKDMLLVSIDEIEDDSSLYSVGIDSINVIEIVIELEEKLNIQFREDDLDMENFQTINSINDICSKLKNSNRKQQA